MSAKPIKAKDRDAILQSLRAGVVPRRGHQHIQVGRHRELNALVGDLDRIGERSSAIRFVIGTFGSGKTFFLSLVRSVALEKRLVTAHADLTPDRRLHSSGGHARALYAELMRNLATRSQPDGNALPNILERFVTGSTTEAQKRGISPAAQMQETMASLHELVGGFDFAQVVESYWRGFDTGDEALKANALRWLRGEFGTKSDAKKALGVRTIVEDGAFYDHLKLMARFVRLAGYGGLLVCLDELVNLYKMANTQARSSNYEQILRILNDSLQGTAESVGFVLGGTPEFLTDGRRGLYSYTALQSRLAENTFARDGVVDLSGPVIRLANLTPEDLYVLLVNLRHVWAAGDPTKYLVPDEALRAFLEHCSKRVGDAYFRTPRNTIKEFLHLLAVLEQNPGSDWKDFLSHMDVSAEEDSDSKPLPEDAEDEPKNVVGDQTSSRVPERASNDDDLSSFRL